MLLENNSKPTFSLKTLTDTTGIAIKYKSIKNIKQILLLQIKKLRHIINNEIPSKT